MPEETPQNPRLPEPVEATAPEAPPLPVERFNPETADATHVSGMYKTWFLDYASYVILERAVPHIDDGLKPVQRRILHSMYELEDGRYNKVANVVGNTMKYHPHGDASITDAMVQLGQRELIIDTQGNWGNILTGDFAAAPRYIEARLSKFGLEVAFNPKTTLRQPSYDGRNQEPITLPMKFPLLLAQGVEGIAVGLACKILPHNFNELIDASIKVLHGKKTHILPDFPTGGTADFSEYNRGMRGGKIRVRATISQTGKYELVITEIPFGSTTISLMESILAANAKEKIKIRKIEDNTAEEVEIVIHLPQGADPDKTISPNSCVIKDGKPTFLTVDDLLKLSTERTLALLKKELEIRLAELQENWHLSSLEKIFIEKKIYQRIEKAETWEEVLDEIETGVKPYRRLFKREITRDDLAKLTEIKIKRISKYNSFKADEEIKRIESEMRETKHHLKHLVPYAIAYFEALKKKYGGPARKRKTKSGRFDEIVASQVARANRKLFVNRREGFVGWGLRQDEFVFECSDLDDIIVFMKNGTVQVSKVAEKAFFGKQIIHLALFKRNDGKTVYNMIYEDGKNKRSYAKRFPMTGVIRDKLYDLTRGRKGTKVLWFTVNAGGETEKLIAWFEPNRREKNNEKFKFDFSTVEVKGREIKGDSISDYAIKKFELS
jgi:topoisomerase-4 subunit A